MDEPSRPPAETLFDLPAVAPVPAATPGPAAPRLQRADRAQVQLRPVDLEALLPAEHRARLVWEWVMTLDLSAFHERIRAVEGHPGRPAIDPAILVALWLYATLEGVGSARALERLCREHDAYRWLCGGVSVNHHTLADVRVEHAAALDGLLTSSVAALLAEGLVSLERTAQDGLRVRAAAGEGSFRRRDALDAALAEASARVRTLRAELEADPAATSRRLAARRERAARERVEALERALARLPELEARKARPTYRGRRDVPAEASTTDAEASFMRFPDGGSRPGWNVQLASDVGSGLVVGVDVVAVTDQGQLGPMVDQLGQRYGRTPAEHLVDGGYRHFGDLERLAGAESPTLVYMPVPRPRKGAPRDPHRPCRGDGPGVTAWRVRMGTEAAKAIYRGRSATAEWVNAGLHNRGLTAVTVRGRLKTLAVALWQALAHNLLGSLRLRAAAALPAT